MRLILLACLLVFGLMAIILLRPNRNSSYVRGAVVTIILTLLVVEIVWEAEKVCRSFWTRDFFAFLSLTGCHGHHPSAAVCCLSFVSTLPGSNIGFTLLLQIKLCGTTWELWQCRKVVGIFWMRKTQVYCKVITVFWLDILSCWQVFKNKTHIRFCHVLAFYICS